MPAGDGTGPRGMGPLTGRGAGYCAGYDAPAYAGPMPGRGFGMGRGRGLARGGGWGRGRGWRHQYYATGMPGWVRYGYAPAWGVPPTPAQETEFLKAQAEGLKEQLDTISQRIAALEQE